MSDTLDGMTVEQLDDLIKRAEATKKKALERDWIILPDYNKDKLRVSKNWKKMQYCRYGNWIDLPAHSDALRFVCDNLSSSTDRRNVANALIALSE